MLDLDAVERDIKTATGLVKVFGTPPLLRAVVGHAAALLAALREIGGIVVHCPACDGLGRDADNMGRCRACEGDGDVEVLRLIAKFQASEDRPHG